MSGYSALTVRAAFERLHKSSSHAPQTIDEYEISLNHWERLTDNPTLAICDGNSALMHEFRERMLALPTPKGVMLTPKTVNKHLRQISAILSRMGPRGPGRRRQNHGIIAEVPWVEEAAETDPDPRLVTHEQLTAIYDETGSMTWPTHCGVSPPQWWRTLEVVLYNIGMRRGDWLGLKCEHVLFSARAIMVGQRKKRKPQLKPMNATVIGHLQRFMTPSREFVFPCTTSLGWLYESWHRLQDRAGIPEPHLTFHDLRRACGTAIYSASPGAAQEMLGHSTMEVTKRHYANLTQHVVDVAEALEQPACFRLSDAPRPLDDPPQFRIVG